MDTLTNDKGSLASQPVNKLFWRYSLPAVAGMLVNGLYSTIDGIFIGQAIGAEGLAAMNIIWPVFGLILGIGLMFGMGTAALYSIARGEQAEERARAILGNGVTLMVLGSLLLGAFIYHYGHIALLWMGAKGSVLEMGQEYLRYIGMGSFAALMGAALPMMVRNDERPQLSTLILSVGALANIALDYLFIIHLQMGVAGAALATILAQSITMIWGIGYFFSSKARLRLRLSDMACTLSTWKSIMVTGLPSFTMFVYISFVIAVHNRLFLDYGNVTILAAFTIVGYIQAIYYMIAEGIANGLQPLLSYNYGARNNANIRKTLGLGLKSVLILGLATVLFINLFPEAIAYVFNSENTRLISETATGLRLHLFSMFLDGLIVVAAAYFQALARSRIATIITVGNMVVQIPLLLILPEFLGVTGVWIALPLSNIFLAVVVVYALILDLKERPAAIR
ncbi:MAG: MATE family efflux transporter [Endozoicomonas sp.]